MVDGPASAFSSMTHDIVSVTVLGPVVKVTIGYNCIIV